MLFSSLKTGMMMEMSLRLGEGGGALTPSIVAMLSLTSLSSYRRIKFGKKHSTLLSDAREKG